MDRAGPQAPLRLGSRPASPRWLFAALVLIALNGCTALERHWDSQNIAGPLSATNGTRITVAAFRGWAGENLSPFINLFDGNLLIHYPLLSVRGIGWNWDLTLYYNSTQSGESTTLGPGWRLSYHVRLVIGAPDPTSITVRWGDGRRDVFTDDGAGGWEADPSLEGRTIVAIAGGYRLRTKHDVLYQFDTLGQLVALVDRNGNTMSFTHASGRLATITDASGRSVALAYNGSGLLTDISGLPAQPIQLQYTGGRLTKVVHPSGYGCDFAYNGHGELQTVTDPDGQPFHVFYHASVPTAVKSVVIAGARRDVAYDPTTLTTTVKDSLSSTRESVTKYRFDAEGLCLSVDDGPLGVTQNVYDPTTNYMTSHTDAAGKVTLVAVDAIGNVVNTTDPLGLTTTFTYGAHNLVTSVVDRTGQTWAIVRDGAGNPTVFRSPLLHEVQLTVTPQGLPATRRDPNGNVTVYSHDLDGNLVQITDPAGNSFLATYNGRGRVTSVRDRRANTYTIALTARDEVASVSMPGGGTYSLSWTPSGKLASAQDPLSAMWSVGFDAVKQIVSSQNATGHVTSYVRDGAADVVQLIDPMGRSASIDRDLAGRPLTITDFEGVPWNYAWDCCKLVSATDGLGIVTALGYSDRYELVSANSVAPPLSVQMTAAHDNEGRQVVAKKVTGADPPVEYRITRDAAGRAIVTEAVHLGRADTTGYDAAGNPIRVSDNLRPAGGVTFAYDNRNDPILVSVASPPVSAAVTYNPDEQIQHITYSNGENVDFGHDANGWLRTILVNSPSFNANYNMNYDLAGDLENEFINSPATGLLQMFALRDPNGRVLQERYVPGTITDFGYNPNGTRAVRIVSGNPEPCTYSPGGYRLLSQGSYSQVWNANGDVVQDNRPGFTHGHSFNADRTIASTSENGPSVALLGGPLGEIARVTPSVGPVQWRAFSPNSADGGLLRMSIMAAPLAVPSEENIYLPGASAPILRLKAPFGAGSRDALLPGSHGTSIVTNSAAAVTWSEHTNLFGEKVAQSGTQPPRQGYASTENVSLNLDNWVLDPSLMASIWRTAASTGYDAWWNGLTDLQRKHYREGRTSSGGVFLSPPNHVWDASFQAQRLETQQPLLYKPRTGTSMTTGGGIGMGGGGVGGGARPGQDMGVGLDYTPSRGVRFEVPLEPAAPPQRWIAVRMTDYLPPGVFLGAPWPLMPWTDPPRDPPYPDPRYVNPRVATEDFPYWYLRALLRHFGRDIP